MGNEQDREREYWQDLARGMNLDALAAEAERKEKEAEEKDA